MLTNGSRFTDSLGGEAKARRVHPQCSAARGGEEIGEGKSKEGGTYQASTKSSALGLGF